MNKIDQDGEDVQDICAIHARDLRRRFWFGEGGCCGRIAGGEYYWSIVEADIGGAKTRRINEAEHKSLEPTSPTPQSSESKPSTHTVEIFANGLLKAGFRSCVRESRIMEHCLEK